MSIAASATALLAAAALANPQIPPAGTPTPATLSTGEHSTASAVDNTTGGLGAQASWTWPLHPRPDVVRSFAPPEQRWLPGHRGVDLLVSAPGDVVLSPAEGRIRFAGRVADKDVVVVEHAGGLRSTFEPAASSLPVGTPVARGHAIATVTGAPGHCLPSTCLHWGVLRGDTYLDPLSLIGDQPVRLLPLGD